MPVTIFGKTISVRTVLTVRATRRRTAAQPSTSTAQDRLSLSPPPEEKVSAPVPGVMTVVTASDSDSES